MRAAAKASVEGETVSDSAEGEAADEVARPARLKGWEPSKAACAIVGAELVCAIIVAWVVSLALGLYSGLMQ
jgi:hypothetical protein